MSDVRTDYHRPGVTWVDEEKSRAAARRFAAACGRLGVFACPVRNEDGKWTVAMYA